MLTMHKNKISLPWISSVLFALALGMLSVTVFAKPALDIKFATETLTSDLKKPWGVAAIADKGFLITERDGAVRFWNNKTQSLSTANKQFVDRVYESGQGGMLDVIAHPDFAQNNKVYFTYSAGHRFSNGTTLASALLNIKGNEIEFSDIKVLFRPRPMKAATYHFAGRMVFLPDNTLVFGIGDGYSYMDDAQELNSHLGKIIRLNDDGSVPKDNPFVSNKNALPEIYSLGHRNPQGLYYDAERKLLFSNEHGPKGGDEINIIEPKLNYGWPEITYGIDYTGFEITPHKTKPGLESPLVDWTPSIAPSSILSYQGKEFPELNGILLNTALKYRELRAVKLKKDKSLIQDKSNTSHSGYTLEYQQTFLKDMNERLRDIELDAQGRILLLTDSGKLIRLSKK